MINVEKTYILHYSKLNDRRKRLESELSKYNIQADWILDFDQEYLTESMINESYDKSKESYNKKINPTYGLRTTPHRLLNIAEISCTFKHREAIKRISIECDNYGLILEDDVVFCNDFDIHFNTFMKSTPDDWDAIFMGSCANLHVPSSILKNSQTAYRIAHPSSRGGDSYLLKRDLAQKITESMKTFVTISDWELSYQLYLHDAKTYWWEPSLIAQGSECGLYKSTLR